MLTKKIILLQFLLFISFNLMAKKSHAINIKKDTINIFQISVDSLEVTINYFYDSIPKLEFIIKNNYKSKFIYIKKDLWFSNYNVCLFKEGNLIMNYFESDYGKNLNVNLQLIEIAQNSKLNFTKFIYERYKGYEGVYTLIDSDFVLRHLKLIIFSLEYLKEDFKKENLELQRFFFNKRRDSILIKIPNTVDMQYR